MAFTTKSPLESNVAPSKFAVFSAKITTLSPLIFDPICVVSTLEVLVVVVVNESVTFAVVSPSSASVLNPNSSFLTVVFSVSVNFCAVILTSPCVLPKITLV
ncbi:membrane protein [Bathymodiolus azoricus thioautotrophic gill symbiont]|uniref:Membrane protein n=1 Tax=Bathymodiolus azoricus thioautotrophic gill symbiont TaxID=235205 RepID=A0A1H6K473_9GAMM|nr:membrane protein [Bathymodiolus azoricus thioautotrophic gill symbiont]